MLLFVVVFFIFFPDSHDGKFIISGSENQYIYMWKTHHDYAKFSSARRDRNDYWEAIKGDFPWMIPYLLINKQLIEFWRLFFFCPFSSQCGSDLGCFCSRFSFTNWANGAPPTQTAGRKDVFTNGHRHNCFVVVFFFPFFFVAARLRLRFSQCWFQWHHQSFCK